MHSRVEYFRNRLLQHDQVMNQIELELKQKKENIKKVVGKKRKYQDALGYENDYLVVQDPDQKNAVNNGRKDWIDAYSQNLFNE
jgi:hypothetical protein